MKEKSVLSKVESILLYVSSGLFWNFTFANYVCSYLCKSTLFWQNEAK